MTSYKIARDVNGNKICKIIPGNNLRGFSIQTNGNLPQTNRNGIGAAWTPGEVSEYVKKFGTKRQKEILGF